MYFSLVLSLLRIVGTSAADAAVEAVPTQVTSAADAAAAAAKAAAPAGSACTENPWMVLVLYAVVLAFFWLLFIRPNKKRRQEEEKLRKSVEIGDEIITIGGICGRIVSIKDDETIVIESGADRTKLKLKTWSISTNETARDKAAAAEAAKPKKKGLFSSLKKDDDEEK